jgi:hypothetical protein
MTQLRKMVCGDQSVTVNFVSYVIVTVLRTR